MFEKALAVYGFNLEHCERMAAGIAEHELYMRPVDAMHTPAWILGHIAVTTDYALQLMGLDRAFSEAWHGAFGMNSSGEIDLEPAPGKEELLTALRQGHERVSAAAREVSERRLAHGHGVKMFEGTTIRTIGDLVEHLMTAHEAMHLGQLTMCCRVMGKERVL